MMKNVLLFGVLLTIGIFSRAMAQQDAEAYKILKDMSDKYQNLDAFQADFTYSLIDPVTDTQEDIEGQVTVKGENYKLDLGNQEVLNDGKTQWTFLKDANEVTISDYEPDPEEVSLNNIFTLYEEGYKYQFLEQKNGVNIVDLEPEYGNQEIAKIRMEIKADNSLQSFSLFEKGTNIRYVYQVNTFEENVKLADDYFTWNEKDHKDVDIIDFRNN